MFDILVIQKSQPVTKSLRNIPAEAATGGVTKKGIIKNLCKIHRKTHVFQLQLY